MSNAPEVRQVLVKTINKVRTDLGREELTPQDSDALTGEIGLDSLDLAVLVVSLEKECIVYYSHGNGWNSRFHIVKLSCISLLILRCPCIVYIRDVIKKPGKSLNADQANGYYWFIEFKRRVIKRKNCVCNMVGFSDKTIDRSRMNRGSDIVLSHTNIQYSYFNSFGPTPLITDLS